MNKIEPLSRPAISVKEFCLLYGIGRTGFYEAVARGQIKTVKFGRRTLVPAGEVEAFMAQLASATPGQRGGQ